jgi:hypothetical protein
MSEAPSAYEHPGQWADDLGSLALVANQTPRVAYDLSSIPMSRTAISAIASSLFQSQTPPYNPGD